MPLNWLKGRGVVKVVLQKLFEYRRAAWYCHLNSANKRGENNYRNYDDEAVSRLEFIRHGKSLGYTLSEIRKAMDEWDILSPKDKARLVRSKIKEMDEKIGQLQEFKCHLVEKLKWLESSG